MLTKRFCCNITSVVYFYLHLKLVIPKGLGCRGAQLLQVLRVMSPMKAVIAFVCLIAAKVQISAAINGTEGKKSTIPSVDT